MTFALRSVLFAVLLMALSVPALRAAPVDRRPDALRVAMLSDGGTFADNSFNQNCREGIESLMYSGAPLYVQFFETTDASTFEQHLAAFAERNYRLIIGIGFLMASSIERVAADYPRTFFACVDGDYAKPPHNVLALTFQVDECAFPAGYLAAAWADLQDPADPAVAFVGGMDIPSVNQFVVGFRNGVLHYNSIKGKNVRVLGDYVGHFDRFEKGYEMGTDFIDEGAEVIFGVGSISGNGAIAAAKDRAKWAVGVDTDQYYTLPGQQDILLTSCLKRMDRAVNQTVTSAIDNEFWGGTRYVGNLANHGVGLADFHAFNDLIPDRLQKEILDIQRRLIDGTLSTGWTSPAAE